MSLGTEAKIIAIKLPLELYDKLNIWADGNGLRRAAAARLMIKLFMEQVDLKLDGKERGEPDNES